MFCLRTTVLGIFFTFSTITRFMHLIKFTIQMCKAVFIRMKTCSVVYIMLDLYLYTISGIHYWISRFQDCVLHFVIGIIWLHCASHQHNLNSLAHIKSVVVLSRLNEVLAMMCLIAVVLPSRCKLMFVHNYRYIAVEILRSIRTWCWAQYYSVKTKTMFRLWTRICIFFVGILVICFE